MDGTLEWGPVDLLQKCYCRKSVIKKKLNENKNVKSSQELLLYNVTTYETNS